MRNLSNKKIRATVLLTLVVGIHLLLDILYRPFAYTNSLQDFGLKDSFTQITSVIGISLLMVLLEKESAWEGKRGKILLILTPIIAMVIYEFVQRFMPIAKFDLQDLVYTLVGGIFVVFIQFKIIR